MIDERFIIIGALFSFYGALSYLLATLRGQAKPNRVTWFLWALAPLVAFAAEFEKGVGLISLMTFMAGFNPLLVFIASFLNKKAHWKLNKFDYVYGLISIFAIIIWQLTGEGNLAILFAIIADLLASIPTIVKAYYHPETENSKIFLFGMINSGIALLTISVWSFAHFAFPLYIFLICALFYVLIKFKFGILLQKHFASLQVPH